MSTDKNRDDDLTRPEQLYQQVARRLRQEIQNGRYKPGNLLPSESQISERFHVSRQTVRGAVVLLRSEGLVEVEQGRGTFVRTSTDCLDQIKESLELVDDKIGPDSSLRWLVKEVERLRAQQESKADELKVLYALLEKMVTRLGETFGVNPVTTDPEQLVEMVIYDRNMLSMELNTMINKLGDAFGIDKLTTENPTQFTHMVIRKYKVLQQGETT